MTTPAAAAGNVDINVGYTDPLLGIASWPVTTAAWSVQPPAAGQHGATLSVRMAMQPGALVAPATAPGDAAAASAADIAARFGAVWYQVMQPDMQVLLETSLNQPAKGVPARMPVAVGDLRAHVSGCYVYANAAAQCGAVFADPGATATLAAVCTHYGVDWQALGQAAGERAIGTLVQVPPGGINVPSYAIYRAAGTVAGVIPGDLDPVAVLKDPDNTVLPLNPGTELAVPATLQPQPADGLSLERLAEALFVTPASLIAANRKRQALLAPGFRFAAQGVEVEVPATGQPGADASLDDIAQTFRDNGVPFDAVMAAGASAGEDGMFRPGATLLVDRCIVKPGWSLADNGTEQTVDTLAGLNTGTVDLFPAGTPLFLRATATAGLDTAPLGATARMYGIEPGELLRHNAALTPAAPADGGKSGLPVPGLASLPKPLSNLRVPYRIRRDQTLRAIAALFVSAAPASSGVTPERALAQANRALPGTVAGERTITVAGQVLPTHDGDSFDAVIARANPAVDIDAFADAIADDAHALAAQALLLCPPAQLGGEAPISPAALGQAYGLDPALVLAANAATAGLIVPGVPLKPSPQADKPTVTTAAADSINAIMRRFALAGAAVTIADVAQANADTPFLADGAVLLLPPAETTLAAPFGQNGWQFPDVIFPLQTWVRLTRDRNLVDPDFRGAAGALSAVEQVADPIAVARSVAAANREGDAVTLEAFAKTAEETIDGLKVATGKVLAAQRDGAPTDVWAVSFVDPGGITQVSVVPPATVPGVTGPQPYSFALRPLSNTLKAASGVVIRTLDPESGEWGASQTCDFQGVDLEVWARSWLSGLDLLCTAAYAAPAYTVAPAALGRLLEAKKLLASAVADGLSPILSSQVHDVDIGTPAWKAAREVLYQRLLRQLGSAYDTAAILQFKATVTSPAAAANARLSGAARLGTSDEGRRTHALPPGEDPDAWKVSQLGNAKIALGATTNGMVSFPLDVTQPSRHRAVALDPVYAVNEIEFGITPVTAGFDASNWLSFVRDFKRFAPPAFSAALGAPLVPVPLRAYPELPALVSQVAQTQSDPVTVDEALHWNYVFTYAHQGAAQDQVLLEIEFNRRPNTTRLNEEEDTLFKALAQYVAASDALWQILAQLQGPGANSGNEVLASALGTYADLAERVARLWAVWWGVGTRDPLLQGRAQARPAHVGLVHPSRRAEAQARLRAEAGIPSPSNGARHEFYHYLATLDAEKVRGAEVYVTLTLEQRGADGNVGWPDITVIRDDGHEVPLQGDAPLDGTRVYRFPGGDGAVLVPAYTRLSFRCTIAHLHIASYQNANAAVSVVRNAKLLGSAGPETCSYFIYHTPQLAFPEPLVPLITFDERLEIGGWTDVAGTNPLTPLFDIIFDQDPASREIAVAIRYGQTLVRSDPPIETLLPVKLHPRYTFQPGVTVQDIINAVAAWRGQVQPAPGDCRLWGFDISLYSSTDPALERPLLQLRRLVSPIS